MPGGRPTKYTKAMAKKLLKFFSGKPYREVEVQYTNKKGETWSKFELRANDLPTIAGFCSMVGHHRQTILEWAEKHKEFGDALKKTKELQENFLVTNSMIGLYQQPFAIFTAKNILRWTDKQDIDIKSDGKALTVAGFEVLAPNKDANNNTPTKANS